jgi:hypothetical protein
MRLHMATLMHNIPHNQKTARLTHQVKPAVTHHVTIMGIMICGRAVPQLLSYWVRPELVARTGDVSFIISRIRGIFNHKLADFVNGR